MGSARGRYSVEIRNRHNGYCQRSFWDDWRSAGLPKFHDEGFSTVLHHVTALAAHETGCCCKWDQRHAGLRRLMNRARSKYDRSFQDVAVPDDERDYLMELCFLGVLADKVRDAAKS